MKIAPDFFNNVCQEIDKKYFPEVKYYMDNKHTEKIHYAVELFNNGCSTYRKLIETIAKHTKDSKQNTHKIVSKYIADFEGYKYQICILRKDLWEQDLATPINIGSREEDYIKEPIELEFRWKGREKSGPDFQIFYKGKWWSAEPIDFDFVK
jgi:hypothetical protein